MERSGIAVRVQRLVSCLFEYTGAIVKTVNKLCHIFEARFIHFWDYNIFNLFPLGLRP